MINFKPFENDSQVLTIKGNNDSQLTIENGLDDIIIYGDLSINKNSDPKVVNSLIEALKSVQKNLENKDASSIKPKKSK